ncbi:MAG: peptidoglycan DD-metalloendopeptidase family protein [Legionellaceae bacterium]|nr:peptidoglycan DD-metalloendopeptidase family protein [Legionellaceae bacterium]
MRSEVCMQENKKPSRLLALLALIAAIGLPFLLVKTFHHKTISASTNKKLSLPQAKPTPKRSKSTVVNNEWQALTTREGDSLASIFNRLGLSALNLQDVLKDNPHTKLLTNLQPNQNIQLLIKNKQLEKMIIPFTTTQFLVVYREGALYRSKINSRKMNSHNHYLTANVRGSLYSTAKRLNIPYKLIRQMTEIFNWDIDFSRDVRDGDRFTIIYKAFYIEDKLVGTGDIVAVTYTNRGKSFQAIRHSNAHGEYEYYTAEGNNLKKAFTRYPLKFSHISSTFSLNRYHPVLKKKRPHKGVDLAAPIGTPIYAIGDGRIDIIDRHNGYGNVIKIKHNKHYASVYAHMLRFQKGIAKGDYVKRGQVIGYVGQTGLATGPHCHFEFHIDKKPKNPTTVDLPRAAPVPPQELAMFKAKAGTLLAQLKLFEEAKRIGTGDKEREVV